MAINKPFRFYDSSGNTITGVLAVTYNSQGNEVSRGTSNSKGVAHTTSEPKDKVRFSYPGKKTITRIYGSAPTKVYMSDDPNYVEQNENTMTKNFTVVDQQGVPISGVHVFTSNSNVTVTDIDGKATLSASAGDKITFSHLSYTGQQHPVENVPSKVVLQPGVNQLPEVVITPKKKMNWLKPVGVGLAFMLLITAGKPKKATL